LTALRQPVFDIVLSPKNCAKPRVCAAFSSWTRTGESTIPAIAKLEPVIREIVSEIETLRGVKFVRIS